MIALDMVLGYADLGYQPIPLTPNKDEPKGTPPKGRTGYAGVPFTRSELADLPWRGKRVALRLPDDVVGVDVDAYNGGTDSLAQLEADLGPLPPTVMSHNGRGDGSGIRLYRVPRGSTFRTDPAAGIDMVQWFHRYVIAAPSTHPSGRVYAWHDIAADEPVDYPPEVGELPELPWRWVEKLAAAKGKKATSAATAAEVRAFLDEHTANRRPAALKAVRQFLDDATSGHDTAVTAACWLFREAAAGWYPASTALDLLERWWAQHFAKRTRTPGATELGSIVVWAIAEALADTEAVVELEAEADAEPPTTRRQLLDLVEARYRVGRTDDDRAFLAPVEGPNVALFSGRAKAELAHRMRLGTGVVPSRSALDETWVAVEGEALGAAKESLPLRIAQRDGELVIDLADTTGRAVIVDRGGWRIVERSPVTFRRSKAMMPLDVPVSGGSVDELFDLLNVGAEYRALFTAWVVSTLFEKLPHPIAVLRGQQGAAKTSTARCVTRLVDPCMAATQKPPKAEDDWAQTCTARWVVAVDNVSRVSEWWSDALCRSVTGEGWLRRQLYTDDDVVATAYRRCIMLNGISLGDGLRADLAERLIVFELERPNAWLTEREVDERLDDMRPRVLGAILDQAAATLAALDVVPVPDGGRMADFVYLLTAYDAATGADTVGAYKRQLDQAFDEALEADTVATAVVQYMAGVDDAWQGRASDLLAGLAHYRPTGAFGDERDDRWPRTATQLTIALTRSAPLLHGAGIKWYQPPRNKRGSVHRLSWITPPSASTSGAGDAGDALSPFVGADRGNEEQRRETEKREEQSTETATKRASASPASPTAAAVLIELDKPW